MTDNNKEQTEGQRISTLFEDSLDQVDVIRMGRLIDVAISESLQEQKERNHFVNDEAMRHLMAVNEELNVGLIEVIKRSFKEGVASGRNATLISPSVLYELSSVKELVDNLYCNKDIDFEIHNGEMRGDENGE